MAQQTEGWELVIGFGKVEDNGDPEKNRFIPMMETEASLNGSNNRKILDGQFRHQL